MEIATIKERVASVRTVLHKLAPNATEMVQTAESFVMEKKDAWSRIWRTYKYEAVRDGNWRKSAANSTSSMVKNPGKSCLLKFDCFVPCFALPELITLNQFMSSIMLLPI